MIYASSGGYKNQTGSDTAAAMLQSGINSIELSGGSYSPSLLNDLKILKGKGALFQIHNYFPPSEHPYVINLGSLDPHIGELSVKHVERALNWCRELDLSTYSVHAGFLLDPKVQELGQRIHSRDLYDRQSSMKAFLNRIEGLSKHASELGITLMVENNVLSKNNLLEFKCNPLLMCDPKEISSAMKRMPNNVKLLMDVAHLKVSANSLGFDRVEALIGCHDWIGGYHFSDNSGLSDSNDPFTSESWFWPFINKNLEYYSIEVYGVDFTEMSELIKLASLKLDRIKHG